MGRDFPHLELNRQLVEAASWRIVAELIRRHPELAVIETHQGGGTADALTLLRPGRMMNDGAISLSRVGSAHFHSFEGAPDPDSWTGFWLDYVTAADPRSVVLELERRAGLHAPAVVPASTPCIVAYRVIAAILATAVFGRPSVECRNGMDDNSGMGGTNRRDDLFLAFPQARSRAEQAREGDWLDQPAYRFWFIERESEPLLAIEPTSGTVWNRAGLRLDLARLWSASGRRVGLVASWVGADLLV